MSMNTAGTPRIVFEAEKIVHDAWQQMGPYERWRLKAVAETMERRRLRQEAAAR